MPKVFTTILGAAMFLFIGIFVGKAEAAALNGMLGVQPWSTQALVKKATCTEADDFCEKDKYSSCNQGGHGWECACQECDTAHPPPPCPKNPSCHCSPGTLCQDPTTGSWCYCPR
jgi:hypothetical protein